MKADMYGTAFLETINRMNEVRPVDQINESRPTGGSSLRVLRELVKGPEPLPKLMTTVNMEFRAFAEALRQMEDAGWLAVRRRGTEDFAELTGIGAQIVDLSAR